jgi:hypothetical protein
VVFPEASDTCREGSCPDHFVVGAFVRACNLCELQYQCTPARTLKFRLNRWQMNNRQSYDFFAKKLHVAACKLQLN